MPETWNTLHARGADLDNPRRGELQSGQRHRRGLWPMSPHVADKSTQGHTKYICSTREGERRMTDTQAKLVLHDPESGIWLAWHGGHTVHLLLQGREVTVASVGDFSRESITAAEAYDEIVRLVESGAAEELVQGELLAAR